MLMGHKGANGRQNMTDTYLNIAVKRNAFLSPVERDVTGCYWARTQSNVMTG